MTDRENKLIERLMQGDMEAYIVNQTFGDSYIRASNKCFDIKGELKEADPKTAFLEELKNLLEKYNVDIAVEDGGCNVALYAYFDGEVSIDFWCEEITRQGLKDKQYTIYDKE